MTKTHTLTTAIALCIAAGPAMAQHLDAFLIIDGNDKLVTGGFNFEAGTIDNTDTRVFEGEFDETGFSDEPGFNALGSDSPSFPAGFSALPGSTNVNFKANALAIGSQTSNLWHWDGVGPVEFTPVSAGTTLTIALGLSAVLDGSASDVTGFTIDTTGASGFLHRHLNFTVNTPTADDGFYLWSLTLDVGAYATDPIFFVHDLGIENEERHEAAIDYVQDNLVPEPSSALALLIGSGLIAARRRRRN